MANWGGTHTIASGTTGTSTGGNGTATFKNTGASWPTSGNTLTNYTLRVLTGTGAGQTRTISTNTATQITVSADWSVVPDNTSTYEIVLLMKNGDHVTSSMVINSGIIMEGDDGATIYFDGNYNISANNLNTTFRFGKTTVSNMVTFCANNRTVVGKAAFWGSFIFSIEVTYAAFSFVKFMDGAYGLRGNITMDPTLVHHLWFENCTTAAGWSYGTTTATKSLSNIYHKRCTIAAGIAGGASTDTGHGIVENSWGEMAGNGCVSWIGSGVINQTYRNNVYKRMGISGAVSLTDSLIGRLHDCYINPRAIDVSARLIGGTSTAHTGSYFLSRNYILRGSGSIYGATGVNATGTVASAFNDFIGGQPTSLQPTDISSSSNYSSITSDNDYIAGYNNACLENIDTTMSTTSTADPQQYKNLTATRTNAKSVLNRPLSIDNISVGTPTTSTVTITYDCVNGAVSGQGSTTVDADSNSGQATLSVADTTGFEVGELVEIGYGTVRYEKLRVLSISAGDSITFETNLSYTHTAVQADTVKKNLRQSGLAFIKYGTSTGNYTMSSNLPKDEDWGLIWTGIKTTIDGVTYTWKQVGHSVTLLGLTPNTKYYYKLCYVNPVGEVVEGTESDFTTAAVPGNTYGFAIIS